MDNGVTPLEQDLATSLRAFAQGAAEQAANILASHGPRAGANAAAWMRATREALEAVKIADEALPDTERGAFEQLVRHQRDELAAFLTRLAEEFESADTPTAKRRAERIRREVGSHAADFVADREADEAADEVAR